MRSGINLAVKGSNLQLTRQARGAAAEAAGAGGAAIGADVERAYQALHAAEAAQARTSDRATFFNEICRMSVQEAGAGIGFIGEAGLSPDALPGSFQIVAWNASESAESSALALPGSGDQGLHPSPFADALLSGRSMAWNALSSGQQDSGWARSIIGTGCQAAYATPIRVHGRIWGVLGLYRQEANFFDLSHERFFEALAASIARQLEQSLRATELQLLQARLAESEALMSSVLNAAFDPVICLDERGQIIVFNPAAARILGWEAQEALGQGFVDVFVPSRFRALRRQAWAKFMATGQSRFTNMRREVVALRRDGSELPMEIITIAARYDSRLIVTLYLRDISEIKRNQEVLSEIASRYRRLVENSPEALLVHRGGLMLLTNKACRRLLGVAEEGQLLGRSLFELVRPDYQAAAQQATRAVATELTGGHFLEQVWVRVDGREITLEVGATQVEYEGLTAYQVVLRDITERKRFEDTQARQNHVLSLIAADVGLPEIMRQLVALIETGSVRTRAMTLLLAAGGTFLEGAVAPSFGPGFIESVEHLPVRDGESLCGTAAYRGVPVIVRDVRTDPLVAAFAEISAEHRIGAAASWPIMGKRGQILGTFSVYYTEPCEPNDLEMGLIAMATDLAGIAIEAQLADRRIRHLAHYDELTGLPNRVLFRQMLEQALEKTRARTGKLATLFLDLDRFKNINDTFGHGTGDDVLREVGTRLRASLRECDQIARMGGDEFFVLLDSFSELGEVTEVARRILEVAARPFFINGEECQLSASIGIAVYPDDGEDGGTLLKNADIAMYRAKGQGTNTFQFYSASKNIHTVQRMSLQSRLRRAIENKEFVLHYQPRVDMQTGLVMGVEALVRWQHPERGLLPPFEFISIAEETGLIVPLGRNILEIAFRDAKRFEAALGRKLRTAVNLSVRQIDEPNFVQEVRTLLEENALDADAIELEITESMLIHNPEHAEQVVGELHALGLAVSIDDFGTGYSSLTYLKRFPVETVKIDRSFIKDLPDNANDLAITQAIIAMAHSLGLKVVAEGVETPEQVVTLRAMHCDEYQGYLFSKPVPLEQVLALMLPAQPAS